MAFTEEQRALIKQTAWEVGEELDKRHQERTEQAIRLHAAECPTRETVAGGKKFIAGAAAVAGLAAAVIAILAQAAWSGIKASLLAGSK